MVIVEFCGTPGCGKTTLCDEVETELRARGYKVKNLQKLKQDESFIGKIRKVVLRYLYRYIPSNHKLKRALNKIKPYLSKDSQINWIDRILESSYKVKKAEASGVEIGLFDEGCLQFITSVFHEKEVAPEAKKVLEVLINQVYQKRTIILHCQIEEEENYLRLVKRGRVDDRFLRGGKEDTFRLLNRKRRNIDTVLDMVEEKDASLVVTRTGIPEKNMILEKIFHMSRGKAGES